MRTSLRPDRQPGSDEEGRLPTGLHQQARLTAGLKTGGRDWVAVRQRKSLLIGIELYYGKVIA